MDATRWLPLLCGSLALVLGTACDINVNDDGDGDGDGAGTDGDGDGGSDGNADDGDGDADETGDGNGDAPDDNADAPDDNGDAPDDDGNDTGPAGGDPTSGLWLYTETGGASSTCDFLGPNPSNGFGEYEVVASESGGWLVFPGDGTDPFSCATSGGSFECDERLQDTISSGRSSIEVIVGVTGQLPSSEEMTGTQHGRADCEGPDCALAEQLLGNSFPCTFEIPFEGSKL